MSSDIGDYTTSTAALTAGFRILRTERNTMRRLVLSTLALVALAFTANAVAATTAKWTPAQAAAKLKATYTTVDPKAVAAAQEHIDALLKGGASETDPLIVSLREDQRKAQHAAVVTTARCVGVGTKARRYTRFHCTAVVAATERTPPDHQFYTATVKVTVSVAHGFGVKSGWR